MRRAFVGAALIVAGIAGFIEAHSHRPIYGCPWGAERCSVNAPNVLEPGSLDQTAYDLLRIGAWALLVFGALLVAVGLIGYYRRPGLPG
jgi:hypothetical protein